MKALRRIMSIFLAATLFVSLSINAMAGWAGWSTIQNSFNSLGLSNVPIFGHVATFSNTKFNPTHVEWSVPPRPDISVWGKMTTEPGVVTFEQSMNIVDGARYPETTSIQYLFESETHVTIAVGDGPAISVPSNILHMGNDSSAKYDVTLNSPSEQIVITAKKSGLDTLRLVITQNPLGSYVVNHTLTFEGTLGGSIQVNNAYALSEGAQAFEYLAAGEQVSLKVHQISNGYAFEKWISTDGGVFADQYAQTTTFTTPDNDTTVYASFKPITGSIKTPGSTYSPGGTSSGSDSSGSSRTSNTWGTPAPTSVTRTSTDTKALADAARKDGQSVARSKGTGKVTIKGDAWKQLSGLSLQHDTIANRIVQVRVTIQNPTAMSGDIMVSGYVKGSDVDRVSSHFRKHFLNAMHVIHLDQTVEWGQDVRIAAKIDLSGMDVNNLVFYSYDRQTNSYKRISAPGYRIDANGYVHFTTSYAGSVVVSDGALVRK